MSRELWAVGFPVCPECGGEGFVVTEHIRTVAEHHPNCDGGFDCSSTCPVAVPVPEYEQEHCPNPSCVEGAVVSDELREDVAELFREYGKNHRDVLRGIDDAGSVDATVFALATVAAVLRHLKAREGAGE